MTDDRTLERAARSWLEAGPTEAPDRAVDAALSRIESIRQERDLRIPWRLPTLNPITRVAALIVAIAAVGSAVYLVGGAWNGPRPTDSPRPTPAALATVEQLNGPWRSVPYVLPVDVLATAEAACLADPDITGPAQLVVADARGAETVFAGVVVGTLGFQLQNGDFAYCHVQQFGSRVSKASIDTKGCALLPTPTAGARCLSELPVPAHQIVGFIRGPAEFAGKVGPGITAIRLVFANGQSAEATMQGEWFAVYGPVEAPSDSYMLEALDASGDVLATFAPPR